LQDDNGMDSNEITCISLCSGYEGIGLGLKRVLPNLRTIAYVEIEMYACAVLAKRMEEGKLDIAPIWTDVKTFPAEAFHGKVHILTSGYPCQPFSVAGKRKGTDDPRHLWPHIERIIKAVRPVWCIFENVPGHLTIGFPEVYCSLRDMGYKVEAGLFTAAEVGAPHKRQRLFIMAHTGLDARCSVFKQQQKECAEELSRSGQLADTERPRLERYIPEFEQERWQEARRLAARCGEVRREWIRVIHANECEDIYGDKEELLCPRCGIDYAECPCPGPTEEGLEYREENGELWCRRIDAWPSRPGQPQYEWEEPRVVMSRADSTFLKGYVEKYQTAITERQVEELAYAVDSYALEPFVGKSTHGITSNVDQLRLLGNGVVPQCAEKAIRELMNEFEI